MSELERAGVWAKEAGGTASTLTWKEEDIYSGPRSESLWLEWRGLFISRGEAREWMQKPAMKGYMNPREIFRVHSKDNVESPTLLIMGAKRPDMPFRVFQLQ